MNRNRVCGKNVVGRSRAFWEVYYGELQTTFPGTLDDVFGR